jgi:hypothetical protein
MLDQKISVFKQYEDSEESGCLTSCNKSVFCTIRANAAGIAASSMSKLCGGTRWAMLVTWIEDRVNSHGCKVKSSEVF